MAETVLLKDSPDEIHALGDLGIRATRHRPILKDGVIHAHCAGRKMFGVGKDGNHLIIFLADENGKATTEFIRVGWVDPDTEELLAGEPAFCGQSVKQALPVPPEGVGLVYPEVARR